MPVLRLNCIINVSGREPQLRHLVGIDPHPHAVILLTREHGISDARQTSDLVDQIDSGVIVQKQGVVAIVRSSERNKQQERRGDFLRSNADALHFRRQQRQRHADLVLNLDRRKVGIGSQFESNVDGQSAVVRCAREIVQHAIQTGKLLLNGLRNRFLKVGRIAALINCRDLHNRRDDFGIRGDGQRRDDNAAENNDHDRDNDREHRTVDKESCHGST